MSRHSSSAPPDRLRSLLTSSSGLTRSSCSWAPTRSPFSSRTAFGQSTRYSMYPCWSPRPLMRSRSGPTSPPPVYVDDEPDFEIAKVLGSKVDNCRHKCRLLYLVCWTGYKGTDEETSWILTISVATAWLAGLVASQPWLQVASNHDISQAIAILIASWSVAAASCG